MLLRPDEGTTVVRAYNMAESHTLDIQGYEHPDGIDKKIDSVLMRVASRFLYHQPLQTAFHAHTADFYILCRTVTACFGIACVLVAYLIGKRIRAAAGLFCAFLFAVFPSFVENGHYATPDAILVFFFLGVVLCCIQYLEDPRLRNLFLMALFAALAMWEKYPGALLCLPIALTVLFANRKSIPKLLLHLAGVIALFVGLAFLIAPEMFLDFHAVLLDVHAEARPHHLGADNLHYIGKLLFYLGCFWKEGGLLLSAAAVLGAVVLGLRKSRLLIPLSAGIFYLFCISGVTLYWERWGTPIFAGLLLFSAAGLDWTLHLLLRLRQKWKQRGTARKAGVVCVSALFVLCLINPTLNATALTTTFATPDTRNAALAYCDAHGITAANTADNGYSPLQPSMALPITTQLGLTHGKLTPDNPYARYVILSQEMDARFEQQPRTYPAQVSIIDTVRNTLPLMHSFQPPVYQNSACEPLNIYHQIRYFTNLAKTGYGGSGIWVYELPHIQP